MFNMIFCGSHTTPSCQNFQAYMKLGKKVYSYNVDENINDFIVKFQDKNKAQMVNASLEIIK